jgi:hypothetical protein
MGGHGGHGGHDRRGRHGGHGGHGLVVRAQLVRDPPPTPV